MYTIPKHFVTILICFITTLPSIAQHKQLAGFTYGEVKKPSGEEWKSPEHLAHNKEYPKAYFFSFRNETEAVKVRPEASPYWLSLDGKWKFHWVKTPQKRIKHFYTTSFNPKSWDEISVPSSWNVYGIQKDGSLRYGLPIYVNIPTIFYHKIEKEDWRKGIMRTPPKQWTTYKYRNEVGQYLRTFELPKDWDGREVYIDFDGVDSFFYLWINGKYIGFSKNSRNTASFNITKYLQQGQNTIAVEVYRLSDGSFLESQDMFRLAGIFRSVSLRSTPKIQVHNLNILTTINTTTDTAQLQITTDLFNTDTTLLEGASVEYSIYQNDLYKDTATSLPELTTSQTIPNLSATSQTKVQTTIKVDKPRLWSAETPYRYVLVAKLLNKKQEPIDIVSAHFGFRSVEIKNTTAQEDSFGKAGRYFYINGKPVKLKGVNRHETHPAQGHTLTHPQMEEDIFLMKRANINQVRNSHYPTDPYWYYLCDKYGIYLENEANIESHQYYYGEESLSHPKEWKNAHIARVTEMVESSYNHPSIIMWSLGNEAGPGENFTAAYQSLKQIDTSRPVQYERNNEIVDLGSNQYPSVAWVQEAATGTKDIKYPFHISEYAHSMGNAAGNLSDYWQAIESTNFICGAAVWDWIDQSLYHYTPEGKQFVAYGGDFGDYPNDGQFVMNGLLFADRTPKPQYYEVQKVYQNIKITSLPSLTDTNQFEIYNKNYFTDLSEYKLKAKLFQNGIFLQEYDLTEQLTDITPQQKKIISLYIDKKNFQTDKEYYINFELSLKNNTDWAKKGFVVAKEQLFLQEIPEKNLLKDLYNTKEIQYIANEESFSTDKFKIIFDKQKGTIKQLQYGGNILIENSNVELNAFRPLINNDGWAYKDWFAKGLHRLEHRVTSYQVKKNNDNSYTIRFEVISQAKNGAKISSSISEGRPKIEEESNIPFTESDFHFVSTPIFTIYDDGTIHFRSEIRSNNEKQVLPQLGYLWKIPKAYDTFSYYGRGSQDNYSDRKTGAFIGIYQGKVSNEVVPFAKPQDMGHHQDTRWASLTDENNEGLIFISKKPCDMVALPYSAMDILLAPHPYELPTDNEHIYFQWNIQNTGVGGNSCGPEPLEKDKTYATPHIIEGIIRPVQNLRNIP